jgi:hypothetical protein
MRTITFKYEKSNNEQNVVLTIDKLSSWNSFELNR